jgi:hypothetical protein
MINEGRNKNGQFTKGHRGFKPKGAVSRQKKQQEHQFDWILDKLEKDIVETLPLLSPAQRVKFYVKLISLFVPKLKRIPYQPEPEPEQKTPPKFTFITVPSGNDDDSYLED